MDDTDWHASTCQCSSCMEYCNKQEKVMEKEEVLFVKITPQPVGTNGSPWYVHVPSRDKVEAVVLDCFQKYSKGTKIEVLECTINHCTTAGVVVNW